MPRASRIDGNQASLDKLAADLGAVVIRASVAPELGFDRLYAYRGRLHIVEVKDGGKAPSKRRLTENETRLRDRLEAVGVAYNVIETEADLLRLFGVEPWE